MKIVFTALTVLSAALSAHSSFAAATEARWECNLAPGQPPTRNLTGDGEIVRILISKLSKKSGLVVTYQEARDLRRSTGRTDGVTRDCQLARTASSQVVAGFYLCRNEGEWNMFDLTSTLRLKDNEIDRGEPSFFIEYRSAKNNRSEKGYSEYRDSVRTFACGRVR